MTVYAIEKTQVNVETAKEYIKKINSLNSIHNDTKELVQEFINEIEKWNNQKETNSISWDITIDNKEYTLFLNMDGIGDIDSEIDNIEWILSDYPFLLQKLNITIIASDGYYGRTKQIYK